MIQVLSKCINTQLIHTDKEEPSMHTPTIPIYTLKRALYTHSQQPCTPSKEPCVQEKIIQDSWKSPGYTLKEAIYTQPTETYIHTEKGRGI